jgi:hypothetical protein
MPFGVRVLEHGGMDTRFRIPLFLLASVGAGLVAVVSVLRLIAPDALDRFAELPLGLVGMLAGPLVEAALSLAGALGVLAVVGWVMARADADGAQVWRARGSSAADAGSAASASTSRAPGGRALRAAAVAVALVVAVTTPGGMIPVAGYAFALSVLGGIVALTVLLVLRRPWAGMAVAAVVAGLTAFAAVRLDGGVLLARIVSSFGPEVPAALAGLAHVGSAAALVAWAIVDGPGERGRVARAVLRHRRAITVLAALCAAPYVLARASWLTPWPLFGGSGELFAAEPMVQLTGLMLGLGMLAGAVLTLGLVLPWGRTFPRWMAGLGGRRVPLMLAVAPAVLVALLFTVGGVEFLVAMAVQPEFSGNVLEMTLMLPFWLWGPLLALAAWGYAMDRSDAQTSAPIQRSVRTRQPRVARRASR